MYIHMYTHTYIHSCIHTCVRTLYICTSCSTHASCTLRTCMYSGHKEWSESASVKYIVCMNAPFSTRLRPTRTANAGATPVDIVIVCTCEIHTNGEKKVCTCNNFTITTHTVRWCPAPRQRCLFAWQPKSAGSCGIGTSNPL